MANNANYNDGNYGDGLYPPFPVYYRTITPSILAALSWMTSVVALLTRLRTM